MKLRQLLENDDEFNDDDEGSNEPTPLPPVRRALTPAEKRAILELQQWFLSNGFEQDDSVCAIPTYRPWLVMMGFVRHDKTIDVTLFAEEDAVQWEAKQLCIYEVDSPDRASVNLFAQAKPEEIHDLLNMLEDLIPT